MIIIITWYLICSILFIVDHTLLKILPMNCEVEHQIETDDKYKQPNQGRQMNRAVNNGCHFLLPLSCWGFCVKDAAA